MTISNVCYKYYFITHKSETEAKTKILEISKICRKYEKFKSTKPSSQTLTSPMDVHRNVLRIRSSN